MTHTDIDALARLLDGDPTLNGEATAQTRALGRIAHYLAETPPVTVDPEFRTELRATLIQAARDQAAAPSALIRLRTRVGTAAARWRRSSRVAAATASAALALASGGMAVAADRALPNDALYPAKLVLEDVRIAFVRGDVARGEAHLRQARARMSEAERVAASGDELGTALALIHADDAARSGANQLLRSYQEQGNRLAAERLAAFTDEQQERLTKLDRLLAGDAADAARAVAIGLERIEARLLSMTAGCPTCPGGVPAAAGAHTDIPPAGEDFEACPWCEDLGPSVVTPAAPVQGGAPGPALAPGTPPVVGEPPVAPEDPTVDPPVSEAPVEEPAAGESPAWPVLPEPGVGEPGVSEPGVSEPGVSEPDLSGPDVREPSHDRGETLIDRVIKRVFDLLGE